MWYIKLSWTILVLVVLFTVVTGSCLEYGHSCWGAHGKRSGNRPSIAAKQPTPFAENLAEQLFKNNNNNNNNNNNADSLDDDSNNNNKNYNLPLNAVALSAQQRGDATALERNREMNDAKWAQLLRQHRYQLKQLQRQYDATDAAQSWRKLQQALAEQSEQRQGLQDQQKLPNGEFFELKK